MPGIFAFEADFAGTLVCIPMSVRLKLDAAGIKLTLKQWNRIPDPERRELIERPAGDMREVAAYRDYLVDLIGRTGLPLEYTAVDAAPEWADPQRMPPRIPQWAQGLGIAGPTPSQWASLTPLQRFTLFKLTRPGHTNENFLPALREFGLQP
ncbi:MAG: nitrate reductase associated protein [Proteobacteria bacterium]|nr:nitrate reductase associated protein [Pseudomonadota bacterium]